MSFCNFLDPDTEGYDVFDGVSDCFSEENNLNIKVIEKNMQTINTEQTKQCDSNSNIMNYNTQNTNSSILTFSTTTITQLPAVEKNEVQFEKNIMYDKNIKYKNCTVVLNNIDSHPQISNNPAIIRAVKEKFTKIPEEELLDDSNVDNFEFEESESPLPPIYLLKDEGQEKWVLLNDLCTLLKVKSKDAVLKQV